MDREYTEEREKSSETTVPPSEKGGSKVHVVISEPGSTGSGSGSPMTAMLASKTPIGPSGQAESGASGIPAMLNSNEWIKHHDPYTHRNYIH